MTLGFCVFPPLICEKQISRCFLKLSDLHVILSNLQMEVGLTRTSGSCVAMRLPTNEKITDLAIVYSSIQ